MGILISNLSSTTNIANSDSLILDQSDKTVKITLDELSTHFSLTELQADVELDNLAAISNYTVIGNVSGASAKPSEVPILNQNSLTSNSSTALATQSSIKYYVDENIAPLQTQIDNLIGGGGTSSLYDVWPVAYGPLDPIAANSAYLLTQGTLIDYIDTKVTGILPTQLSTGAPVWDVSGYVTLGAEGVNDDHLVTKGYVDSVVPSGAVGGSSVLRYGEITAGNLSSTNTTIDPNPTTSGDFTTVRSSGINDGENFFTCTFNTPLSNANYNVIIEIFSNGGATYDYDNQVTTVITAKSTNGFQFNAESGAFLRDVTVDTDVSFNVRIESNSAAAITTSQEWETANYVFGTTYTNSTGSPLLINGFGTSAIGTNLSTNVIINAGLANEISLPFVHNWADTDVIGGNQASVTIPNGATYKFEYDPNSNTPATNFFWQQMVTTAVTGSVINGADGPQGPTGPTGPQGPAAATYTLNGTILIITTP